MRYTWFWLGGALMLFAHSYSTSNTFGSGGWTPVEVPLEAGRNIRVPLTVNAAATYFVEVEGKRTSQQRFVLPEAKWAVRHNGRTIAKKDANYSSVEGETILVQFGRFTAPRSGRYELEICVTEPTNSISSLSAFVRINPAKHKEVMTKASNVFGLAMLTWAIAAATGAVEGNLWWRKRVARRASSASA